MFLKNDSNFQCGLRTKKEVLTIMPGQIVHVLDADIISLNSKLVKVTEEEYNNSIKQEQVKHDEPIQVQVELQQNNQQVDEQKEQVEQQVEEQKQDEEQKEQVEEQAEEQVEEQKEDEEQTESQPEQLSVESLEAKLEDLKIQWQQTSRPRRKEAIQKEIKRVQEKLNKLR
jgi:hypothetical protein